MPTHHAYPAPPPSQTNLVCNVMVIAQVILMLWGEQSQLKGYT
jgi:hypothetical protein